MTEKFGKGAVKSSYDIRDFNYKPKVARGAFDWATGYDIEKVIGAKIVTKDQGGSFSCGGQAWGYYGEVLESIATENYEPRSARWIYSHTNVPGGGSNGRENCKFCKNQGWVREVLVISYEGNKPPSEAFMCKIPVLTKEGIEEAETARALSYLNARTNIDTIAQAIQDNYGCVLRVVGQDNGTWHSTYPKPPNEEVWAHFLYAGKAKTIDGKKFIGVKNSWGDDIGDHGWQWLGEDYFASGYIDEAWTLAWDYKPTKIKSFMVQVIGLMQKLIAQLTIKK